MTNENVDKFLKGRQKVLNGFESNICNKGTTHGTGLKILNPKQMLQRLLKALAQVEVGNTSEKLINEIRKIIFFISNKIN